MAKPMTRRTLLGSVGLLGGCAGRKAPMGTLPVAPFPASAGARSRRTG